MRDGRHHHLKLEAFKFINKYIYDVTVSEPLPTEGGARFPAGRTSRAPAPRRRRRGRRWSDRAGPAAPGRRDGAAGALRWSDRVGPAESCTDEVRI